MGALRRIAYLLEKGRESTYRIKAFRGAADALSTLPPDELERRHRAGTLKQLPGIGDKSATIVDEAMDGQQPGYLADCEEKFGGPLVEGGEALFSAITGDLHAHTDWSDGGSPLPEMVLTAVELGQQWLAITDHSPRLTVANGLSAERLTKQLTLIDQVNDSLAGAIRVLKGIEVDINADGSLDQTDAMLDKLDIVTASVHSKLRAPRFEMTPRMLRAVRNPRVNVLGHCTGQLVTGSRGVRPQSTFDAERVFTACLENDVAVEINSRPERCDPPDALIEMARDLGCLFAIDSDAHAPGQLEMKAYGCERAERLGIPAERIVTTWSADEVLAWARP